jgi:peptide subunit release factor 1 (eRF1)
MGVIASRSFSKRREEPALSKAKGREGRERREGSVLNRFSPENGAWLDLDGRGPGQLLERLTRIQPDHYRVVSCYLKLEPRDRSRGKYLIKLKNRVKAAVLGLPRLGLNRDISEPVLRDLDRIQQFLRTPGNLPSTQGVAVFACEGIELFEAVPLPVVHRSRLAIDGSPLVRELASVEDEFGRLLTVVVDRASARFFEVTAYNTRELPGLRSNSTRGKRFHGDQDGSGGWGEHTYHNRIRQEKQRHYEAIARELFTLDRRQPAHGIVLAGLGPEAGAVKPFLHTYLTERLIGTARLNPKDVTLSAVHDTTLAVREDYERASERALVHEMLEGLGTGWGVNGVTPTLRALSRGQVRSLLVDADASRPGFRCGDSGRLALNERECRGEGEPIPILDVVDDAIEEALRQGVDVNVVYEPEARAAIDGLAGLLRFR